MEEAILEAIRGRLRTNAVKLWEPPYYVQGQRVDTAVAGLLHTLFAVRGDCPALAHVHDDMLLQHLCHLQEHAVKKLKAKAAASSSPPSRSTASAATQNCLSLAGSCPVASGPIDVLVKVVGASVPDTQSAPGKKNVVSLSILPTCNGLKLGEEVLRKLFGNAEGKAVTEGSRERRASVRLIVQGRRVGEADAVLSGGQLTSRNGAQILAIVTQRDVETTGADRRKDDASEKILIRARRIREAAKLMAQRDFHGDFELTDQHGRAVPLPPDERASLCAALSLHTLGKKVLKGKLKQADPVVAPDAAPTAGSVRAGSSDPALVPAGPATNSDCGRVAEQQRVAEALSVLLEADAAWGHVGDAWKQRVDNYGMLQLDITWALLNLEHLSGLPDAAARVRRAEEVLSKQVNPNFLKLAIINAEQNRPVPPLAAPFVRLLLVQGVVSLGERNMQAAVDKLSDAHALCKALTVDPIAVEELLRLGAPEEGAIVALRKSNGDVQRAAGEILDQVEARRQASKDRARQRHLGLTADKTGYVDLARIDTVKDFLAVDSEVAVALLRLANNDIDRAANLWHECHRAEHLVLQRADAISSKRPKRALPSHAAGAAAANLPPVDEVALVTLVSTGVDRHLAESALRSTAGRGSDPVEAALEWLTGGEGIPRTDEGARAGAGGTGGNHEAVLAHDDQDASREGSDVSSDTSDDLSDDRMDGDEQLQEEAKHREAFETFQRELGDSLQRQEIGEEHLGLKLEEELYFIEKYLGLAQSTRDTAK